MEGIEKNAASVEPRLNEENKPTIVKVTVDGFEYDGYYDGGWWVNYGGETQGFYDIDESEIEFWTY